MKPQKINYLHKINSGKHSFDSEEKFRSLFNHSPDIIAITNFEREIIECNDSAVDILGYSREELVQMSISDIQFMYDSKELNAITKKLIEKKKLVFESLIVTKDKKEIPVEVNASIIDYLGSQAVILQLRDITERKQVEEIERRNRLTYEALYELNKKLDNSAEEIINSAFELSRKLIDHESSFLYFLDENSSAKQLYSSFDDDEAERFIRQNDIDLRNCIETFQPIIKNDNKAENILFVPVIDGGEIVAISALISKNRKFVKDDTLFLSLLMNELQQLLSRKRSTEQIIESEDRYRNLYENATVGIYRSTPEGKFIMANPVFLKMLGMESLEELKEYGHAEKFYFDPEKRKSFIELLMKEGVVHGFESELQLPNGKKLFIRESAKLVKYKGEKSFEGVVQDITEEKRTKQELIVARIKAEQSDNLKSEFLAQMSHEIRTPLNSMLSAMDLVKSEVADLVDEDIRGTFQVIETSGDRIINTIQAILNMAELQADGYELINSNFDLNKEVIYPVVVKYSKLLKAKGIKLNVNLDDKPILVNLDRYSLTQIFKNIFENAVKYTKHGSIDVQIDLDTEKLKLIVSDTGIGISEEYMANIFEPFSQEAQGYSRPYDGCGLGLALTKKYCDLQDGTISIHSERGVGTSVEVSIPFSN